MFNSPYGRVTPVTTDYTATKDDDVLQVPASETAINTLTLPKATEKDVIYVYNLSPYPQKVAALTGNTIVGQFLMLPNQFARFESDRVSSWYNFSALQRSVVAAQSLSAAQI